MRITIGKTKSDIVFYLIIGAALLFGITYSVLHYPETAAVYLMLGVLLIPRYELNFKTSLIPDLVFPLSAAFLAIYFDHLITMYGHEFYAGYHSVIKFLISHDSFRFQVELILVIAIYFIFRALFIAPNYASFMAAYFPMLFTLADYYVYTLRGSEFIPPDFYGAKTAFSVVGNYHFPLIHPLAFLVLPFFLYVAAMVRIKTNKPVEKWYLREAVTVAVAVLFTVGVFHVTEEIASFRTVMMWADEGTHYNGFVTNFAVMAQSLKIDKPEGYDKESMAALANAGDTCDISDSSNIIVIMNESYSDLSIYTASGALESFEDPMPFWNSLSENAVKGYAYCSVYGGRTPNSEFEFLTGVTTAQLPDGAIPYSMYVNSETYSLPNYLRSCGYSTLAMHPYLPGGWSRTTVYPLIGFDDYMFVEDFNYTESDLIREYVSDRCAYENLVQVLESSSAEKTFTFLVTMQNHGGYTTSYANFPVKDYTTLGGDYGKAVNTFLSLVNESDKALEYLIGYLSEQDEKYTLLIFGDHQPNIDIPGDMGTGGNKWMVPYLLWTNYDMPEDLLAREDRITSLNYLSLDVMEAAGIAPSSYYSYIAGIREEVPVINISGYRDREGNWHGFGERCEAVDKYFDLQYYTLFDN